MTKQTKITKQTKRQKLIFVYLVIFVCFVFSSCSSNSAAPVAALPAAKTESNRTASDETLQRVATKALGDLEGTVIVIDPQTGRLRIVVNPRVAFEQTFPPGSAIKPFTALAALRAGVLDLETKRQCQTTYAQGDFQIVCSHPRSNAPFNLTQALAYSCNDYFAHVGERLSEGTFNATLKSFGFGQRTGAAVNESAGSLSRGDWHVRTALGDDDKLLVTPIQMLAAYVALVNGGHLFTPRQTSDAAFSPQEAALLSISPAQRKVLIEGMRGVVKYGTAQKAQLGKLPFYAFGKTGTSTASNGFRTQGWFAGFAAETPPIGVPAPQQIKLGVLVFLRRAHGAQAAEVAKPIFEAARYGTGSGSDRVGLDELDSHIYPVATAPGSIPVINPQSIRVRSISENVTRELPLEEYVASVLAGESSIEKEFEALKAQAVISRTFALKNLGRHAREGYDFCSTTHCQRFVVLNEKLHAAAQRAVFATRGEVLRDRSGAPIDAYFSAACGGVTANIESLWGVEAPEYLRGVRDDYCAAMPHRRWEQTISAAQLAKALQNDERTNVGPTLKNITVSKRDATGRAEWLTIEGALQIKVRGWNFKIIVGRSLGWQMIKSSRFEVSRAGDGFVFRGGGFGHGLGLCQEGARGAARRGMSYRQIIGFYFPGAQLRRDVAQTVNLRGWLQAASIETMQTNSLRNTASGDHFRISVGAGHDRHEVEAALRVLEAARADLFRRLRQALVRLNEAAPFEVVIHATTAEFIAATGLSGWAAGATRGRRIELQPLKLLQQRNAVTTTLRHELTHAFIEVLGQGRAPRWLAEGLCLHVSGEGLALRRLRIRYSLSTAALERKLAQPASATQAKELYAMAYAQVQSLIEEKGEPYVWRLIAQARS